MGDREHDPAFALTAQLGRVRAAFDHAAIGMATLALTGEVTSANRRLLRTVGRDSDDLVGTSYPALADPAHHQALVEAIAAAVAGDEPRPVEHGLALGASAKWVVSTINVVPDEHEAPHYLFLQMQDISARRVAEEQLRLLVDGVADHAIFMLGPDGTVASWNRGAQRIKGYAAEEIIGRHFRVFYTDEAQALGHPEHELEVAAREGRYEEEGWRVRKDGTRLWANAVITAVHDSAGELAGFAKVTRDVTERRRMLDHRERAAAELSEANEQLAAVAAERAQFLAVTAHELRSPVTVISGFAGTLRDRWSNLDDAKRQEMIGAIARGSEQLERLVEELLTAARLEAGAIDVRPTDFEVGAVIAEVVLDIAGPAAGDISVTADGLRVHADRGRVQQMVGNYLTNALKYGAAPVAVTAAAAGGAVEVRVRDAGSGVPPELVPRLFGRFVRGGDDQGTGLGLFIVRQLAWAQDGDAWYEAPIEGGACFALRLPAASNAG